MPCGGPIQYPSSIVQIIFPFGFNLYLLLLQLGTAASVVSCGGPKKIPRTSFIVHIVFSFGFNFICYVNDRD